jgi:hypothetical protein
VQADVFEEIATMEFPFEGIPTVPPRKDMEHFAFFCDGCRYRCARQAANARLHCATRADAPVAQALLTLRPPAPCTTSVKGAIEETAATIKRRLWEGGCGRGAEMSTGARKVIDTCVAAVPSAVARARLGYARVACG